MTTQPTQDWRGPFDQKFGLPVGDGATVRMTRGSDTMLINYKELILFISSVEQAAITRTKQETEKAFGGCTKCYGKGYATVSEYMSGRGDYDMGQGRVVIDEKMPIMRFCSCSRGEALKKEVSQIKQETIEECKQVILENLYKGSYRGSGVDASVSGHLMASFCLPKELLAALEKLLPSNDK